jgi:hypothetical protein
MPGFQFGKALDLLVGLCANSACGWLHLEASMVVRRGRPVHSIMLGADKLIMCVFLFHETFHQQRIIIILMQVGHLESKLVMQFQNNEVFFNKSLAGIHHNCDYQHDALQVESTFPSFMALIFVDCLLLFLLWLCLLVFSFASYF